MRLVDFNPIGGATSPLLFTWDELKYCSLETEDNEDQEKCVNQTLNNTTSEVEPEGKHSPIAADEHQTVRKGIHHHHS